MSKLTEDQKKFLADLLHTREHSKGKLGGRALDKIKKQYKEFCSRRQKAAAALKSLQELSGGVELGAECQTILDQVDKEVATASDLGDETVFAKAHQELAKVEKDAKSLYESRKSELKKVAGDLKKFTGALDKVKKVGDSKKQSLAAVQLRDLTFQWLQSHHGSDKQGVWGIYQEAAELAGGLGDGGLAQASQELEREAYELRKRIEACEVEELDDENSEYPGLLHDLEQRISKFHDEAERTGNKFVAKLLERTAVVVNQLLWIVDPPPPPDDLPPPLPSNSQTPPNQTPQDTNSPQGGGDTPPQDKPLSNAELAKKKLKDAEGILQYAENELGEVKKDLRDLRTDQQKLVSQDNALKKILEAEYELLDEALKETDDQLNEAEKFLKTAREEYEAAEKSQGEEGKWEEHVEAVAKSVDDAQRAISLSQRPMGRAEGGLVFIQRSLESIKSLKTRLEKIDAQLLETVKGKLPLLKECDQVPATGDQLDMLKHLMLTSEVANDKMSGMLAKARDAKSFEKLVRALMESPKLGTMAITGMLASCHQLLTDVERYYPDRTSFSSTLGELKSKFTDVEALAKQDLGKYTAPVIVPLEGEKLDGQQSVGVAVVGGGPIGLLSAVEARMSGAAQVHVYEGRSDPYSRMNVLKVDSAAAQRLATAGVSETVFPEGYAKNPVACVKTIEEALEARCKNLGIKLDRGLFLKDVKRNDQGKTLLYFKGKEDEPKTCDLLIVATGASVASAQRYADNVVLGTVLGIPFQKAKVKDYAGVGLFKKDSPTPNVTDPNAKTTGWSYDFETEEVKYLVSQLTEEEFNEYTRNPRALLQRIQDDAKTVALSDKPSTSRPIRPSNASKDETVGPDELEQEIDDAWTQILADIGPENFWGSETARKQDEKAVAKAKLAAKKGLLAKLNELRKKNPQALLSPLTIENSVLNSVMNVLGVSRFPIEIQQAQQFVSQDFSGVLVGDSAATPHPSTAKGLNTGIAEMGAVRDLVSGLRRGQGTEEERQNEMRAYEFEVKKRTDIMVSLGLGALQNAVRERIGKLSKKVQQLMEGKGIGYDVFSQWSGPSIRYLNSVVIDKKAAKDDEDWSKREQAVTTLRNYEANLIKAIDSLQQLLGRDEKDTGKLLEPLLAVIPVSTPTPPKDNSTNDTTTNDTTTNDTTGGTTSTEQSNDPMGQTEQTQGQSDESGGEGGKEPLKPEDEYVAPVPSEPIIDGSLPSNPTLYFVPNNAGGNNYFVGGGDPGEPWQSIEQFCAYLSAHWLAGNMKGGLKFSDLQDPQAAIRVLVEMGGDTGNRSGLANQVNYAKKAIGGKEEPKAKLFDDLSKGELKAGSKIWFGSDRHAMAATVVRPGFMLFYDPDTGKPERVTVVEFTQRADSCNSFVVARA